MDNKNIQDKISALLKEYNYVECKNALGETITRVWRTICC